MTKLKKCLNCNEYNLTNICRNCKSKTSDAHYKFLKIRSSPNSNDFFKDH